MVYSPNLITLLTGCLILLKCINLHCIIHREPQQKRRIMSLAKKIIMWDSNWENGIQTSL